MLGQNVKKLQRVWIVGAVVEGKCDLIRPVPQSTERAPEPLSRGRHGLISSRDERCAGGKGEGEHGEIVNKHSAFSTQPNQKQPRIFADPHG